MNAYELEKAVAAACQNSLASYVSKPSDDQNRKEIVNRIGALFETWLKDNATITPNVLCVGTLRALGIKVDAEVDDEAILVLGAYEIKVSMDDDQRITFTFERHAP